MAMTTLSHERAGVARLHLGLTEKFEELLKAARARGPVTDKVHRDRLAALYSEIACMRYSTTLELSKIGRGGQPSATMGSLAKLSWAHCDQELAALAVDLIGMDTLVNADFWGDNLLAVRQASIAGGTTEINKNIVGEHVLGLPR